FIRGIVNDKPIKYMVKFKIRFSPTPNSSIFPPYFHAAIMNPLNGNLLQELEKQYTEKDFLVLPDISAKPIGGYSSIAEKVIYPEMAIRYKREGEVSVKTYLNEKGDVVGVQVLKAEGYGFEKAAVDAIKQTKFEPAYQNGKPIKSIYVIPVEFILNSGEIKIRREEIDAYQKQSENKNIVNTEVVNSYTNENTYFVAVEEMPMPIGGIEGIQNKIIYPETARMAGVEGRVYIKAFIDEKGNVTNAELIKGIGAGCDEEAIRVINETKFKPGKQRGKTVKVQVSIPILFSLDNADAIDTTQHYGYWVGESDKGEEIKVWFLKNGYTELFRGKGGRSNGKITGAVFWPKFKINYKNEPISLDLEHYRSNGELHGKQLCIVKYESPKIMEIGIQKELNKRPKDFSESEVREIWTLKKIKE
ncbi:MAG: energy transducer TonB, partial [Ignavibacteriae bacterium]|nr:energy transducer TonB [Ignavibacteriota bacterium]